MQTTEAAFAEAPGPTTVNPARAGGTGLWVLLALLAGIGAAAGYGLFAFLGAVLAASRLLPRASGLSVRMLGGLLAVVTFLMVCATVADVLDFPLAAPVMSLAALVAFGAAAWWRGQLGRTPPRRGERLIWIIAVVGTLMCLPKMIGDTATHISRLVYGYDNVHHVRMAVASTLERGYFWSPDGVPGLYEAGGGYRPGTSLLAAYLPWIVEGGYATPTVAEVIRGAEAVYALLMVVLSVACVMLLREVAWHDPRSVSPRAVVISGTAVALCVLGGFAPVVTQRGFQAQSLATGAAVVGFVMLTQRAAGLPATGALLLGCSAVLVASHAWPLAALPLAFAVVLATIPHCRSIGVGAWAGAGLLVLLAGYPVYGPVLVNPAASMPTDPAFLSSTSPAVLPLPVLIWAPALIASVAATLLGHHMHLRRSALRVTAAGVAGAMLTSGFVAVAQFHNGQGLGGYYLQKTVYLTTLIGFVLIGAVLFGALAASNRWGRLPAAGTGLLMLLMWAPLATPWAVTHWTNQDPNLLDMRAVDASLARDMEQPTTDSDIIVLGSCNNTTSDYTTRWTGTLLRSWSPARESLVARLGTEGESLNALLEYAQAEGQRTIHVYAKAACPLAAELQSQAPRNVTVELGD